ncbi:chemotaxis protein methyltransferase WspC [Cupriavidus sp. YR651]|uniref:CheR family methyltransferase n=1 Tax=Cupriavidus sp. YR651 TaxID=1855315 RepID=UPI00088DC007|nr:protein-glutamate O-methyltransferase CheR [Cupriavidus sp. YR651]SDC82513.1 chemotaxis protein methyltransferase WspC [Cupriavidus sp. YR651]
MTDAPHPQTPIEALLKERIGLDAASVGAGVIARAIQERQVAVGTHDTTSYWNLLHVVPDELQALIEAVVVPETWFFRHREALLALGRFAAQCVFGRDVPMLRVLSVPCSTGEEPYSIAMALLDAGLPPERFRVDAVDVSARALERARAGQYGNNAFRGSPLDFRDRYFTPVAAGYRIADKVHAQVRLLQGNLLDPVLLASEPAYHVVFCRNLLIYFDPDTQQRAVKTLTRLTTPDGMIFVGPAEASLLTREGLSGAGIPLAFAFHPQAARPPLQPAAASAIPLPAVPAAPRMPSGGIARIRPPHGAVARTPQVAAHLAHAAHVATAPAPAPSRDADALSAIAALADRGELPAATAACERHLAAHGPSADAYCLLGVLHDASGHAADAHAAYRKAVYLDPGHEEALYHLAALLDSEGDAAGAHRLRERAQRHARVSHG